MAKLVDVYRDQKPLGRRQLPLVVDENLTMVMDLNSIVGLICDNKPIKGKELEEFNRKVDLLSSTELIESLKVSQSDIVRVLNQAVPCVGCRRSVERLFYQLYKCGHPTLDPLTVTKEGIITLRADKPITSAGLATLFHGHSSRLNDVVDSQPRRSKKSHRCLLHSLDSQRSRPITPAWRDVWECMRPQCKEEVVLIESSTLHLTLENYLRKHRFCGECRTKVLRAYTLLVEDPEPCKEKGYVSSLYTGIKRCLPDKHIHLQTKTDYISKLISRAEPELMGSRRERHAKTLEIAQEEVLTCLGICVYERLHRIYVRMREEESTCQVFAAVAVETLCRSFETAVELKQGISQLELLYEELTKEEQLKQQRREQKKLKRRRKKERLTDEKENNNCNRCETPVEEEEEEEEMIELLQKTNNILATSPSSITVTESVAATTSTSKLSLINEKLCCLCGINMVSTISGKHNGGKSTMDTICKDCLKNKTLANSLNKTNKCNNNMKTIVQETNAKETTNWYDNNELPTVNCNCESNINNNNTVSKKNGKKSKRPRIRIRSDLQQEQQQNHQHHNHNKQCNCDREQDDSDLSDPLTNSNQHHHHQHNNNSKRIITNGQQQSSTSLIKHETCSSSEHSHDCGYSSENNNGCCETTSGTSSLPSSPEGSEMACSDGCCNLETDSPADYKHSKFFPRTSHTNATNNITLSLQKMLEDSCSLDDDGDCYISEQEVQEFQSKVRHLTEKREELRQTLRTRFAQMCVNGPQPHMQIKQTNNAFK